MNLPIWLAEAMTVLLIEMSTLMQLVGDIGGDPGRPDIFANYEWLFEDPPRAVQRALDTLEATIASQAGRP